MEILNSGVYSITHINSGKTYIGSSKDLKRRLKNHKYYLNKNKHCSPVLQYAWNKYGESEFVFKIILYCSIYNLLFYEQHAINTYNSSVKGFGYNINPVAGSCEGRVSTDEHCKKISLAKKGIKLSDEHKQKLSLAKKGKPGSALGCKHTKEQKNKQSTRMKGCISPNLGRKMSEEQKERLRIINTGKKQSPETIAKRTAKLKGRESNRKGCAPWNKGMVFVEKKEKRWTSSPIKKARTSVRVATYWAIKKGVAL